MGCTDGISRALALADVLVVAPYNAQVGALIEALPPGGARVGTVDKFQGQEAPVVIEFDDKLKPGGCAARHGVSLQPESAERRNLARAVRGDRRRLAELVAPELSDAATNDAGVRLVRGGRDCGAIGGYLTALNAMAADRATTPHPSADQLAAQTALLPPVRGWLR